MTTSKQIDLINDAFISVLKEEHGKAYSEYIKKINRELIDNIDNLDANKVKEIIGKQSINIDNIAILFMIQNAIIEILHRPRQIKKDKSTLMILGLMSMYSLNNPKRFVEKVSHIVKGVGLNERETKARSYITGYREENVKVLAQAQKRAVSDINDSIRKSKISKRMLNDLQKGLDEGKKIATIKRGLKLKYNNENNIKRALDTELHRASETVRQIHSQSLGYTKKTWKTQGDRRVRHTCFHDAIANKTVNIESDFRACGMRAQRPSDTRLPPNESIRCRCYLIYS